MAGTPSVCPGPEQDPQAERTRYGSVFYESQKDEIWKNQDKPQGGRSRSRTYLRLTEAKVTPAARRRS